MSNSKKYASEEEFLASYDIERYDRPSVAADIVAFTIQRIVEENYRRCEKNKLSLLLIKRGEYPFKGSWALPGGFLRPNETIEECAVRETIEETGVEPSAIMPVGVFSEVDRDPRGRIISNAFVSVITNGAENVIGGDDADDARWFDVELDRNDEGIYELRLTNGDITLKARLKEEKKIFGTSKFRIIDSGTLAFDHSAIISTALVTLRKCIGNFEIIFDFLPEKFTLTQLQYVQETVLNVSILAANFRRKVSGYVEETDEYITGAGHRPAKLYKKKL